LDRIVELQQARLALADAKQEVATRKAAFEAENAGLFAHRDTLAARVTELEQMVKTGAVEYYKLNPGDKAAAPGVNIQDRKVIHYDPAAAKNWALDHKMCILLDQKAFEGLCRNETTRPDVATVTTEPAATIAQDLAPVLRTAEAA
jgi:hypothetical protein